MRLFSRLQINTNFLNQDPSYWKNNKSYKIAASMVKNIFVINDIAKKG